MVTLTRLDLERELCRRSLLDFCAHVYIPDPPPAGTGVIQFASWPNLLRLHELVEALPLGGVLNFLKARKIGITSYFEARFVHQAQFLYGAFLPVISQGEKEAQKVIADCRFIWEHLPDHLRADLVIDNSEALKFLKGGTIQAFPATAKAGRSYTGTEVLFDEADFHDNFEASYDALRPLIQDTGGKLFVVSTPSPDKVDSSFRRLYYKAAHKIYQGYFSRPGRTQDSYDYARALASDPARFEKENSRTEEEALSPPRERAYFDVDALQASLNECTDPVAVEGMLSIWKPRIVAGRYIMGADTAWGKTGSYNCAAVFDWATGEQMAEMHGRLDPNDMAYECWQLHRKYNHAYMGLERAGDGQELDGDSVVVVDKVVELLKDCDCRGRLFYADHLSPKPKVPGWRTTKQSRVEMLGEFREAHRDRYVTIHSRAGVGEMMSFVRNEAGRPEASGGAKDDRVMTYAVARQMRKHALFSASTAGPVYIGRNF